MVGLVDGGVLGYWQIIKPQAGTNLVTNPSFEVDGAGWTASSASFARVPASRFGAWCGMLTAVSVNGIVSYNGPILTVGTLVVASAWILADSVNVFFRLNYGASVFQIQHPGDSQWHRLEVATTAVAATIPGISVIDARSSAWTPVYVDGVQFEAGVSVATTYLDGDQDGCVWNGAPHASTSTRDGRDGRGGQIVSLDSVGLRITGWKGSGAPPVDVATQTLALGDGEIYQRSTAKSRVLTLQGLIIGDATGLPSWHAQRRTISDLFRPDSRSGRGPILLRYAGATVPKLLPALYQGGLEMDSLDGTIEKPEIKLLAPQPDWLGETDEQSSITIGQTLSPVSAFVRRMPDGSWSTMGGGVAAGSPARWMYVAQQLLDGRIVLGGTNYLDFGGNAAIDTLGVWDGAAWATLGGAAPNGTYTSAAALGNDGALYVAGDWTTIGGVAAPRLAKWTPSTNTWTALGTAPNGGPNCLVIDPATGYLWAEGGFGTIGGLTTGLAYWNGSTWTSAQAGLPGGWNSVGNQAMCIGPDGRMYLVNAGTTPGIYVWTGAAWALFAATTGSALCMISANGHLYVGGIFTGIGGATVSNIAVSGGSGWSGMNGGVIAGAGGVRTLAAGPGGYIYAAGDTWVSVGGVTPPDSIAVWNGSTWAPFPADPPNTGTHANDIYIVATLRDGSVMVGWFAISGTFGTTMPTEATTTVTNNGSSNAYPVVKFDAAGTVYTLANLTTGQRISFSGCTLVAGELGTLDLRPGRKTFSTQVRALIATVLPGSDLATFALAPGANRISLMTTGGTVSMFWRDSFWSAD